MLKKVISTIYTNNKSFWYWVFIYIALILLFAMVIGFASTIIEVDNIAYEISGMLSIILTVIWYKLKVKDDLIATITGKSYVVVGILAVFTGISLSMVNQYMVNYSYLDEQLAVMVANEQSGGLGIGDLFSMIPSVTVWTILSRCLIGPILEEFIYRRILYRELVRNTNRWLALVIINGIFALGHGYGLKGMIFVFAIGLVATLLYDYTGKIIVAILFHIGVNSGFYIVPIMAMKIPSIREALYVYDMELGTGEFQMVGAVIGIMGVLLILGGIKTTLKSVTL